MARAISHPKLWLTLHGFVAVVMPALMLMLTACASSAGPAQAREEVILRLPGRSIFALAGATDGTLFAAGPTGLWRSSAGEPERWDSLGAPPAPVIQLHVRSRDSVYFVTQACGRVYSWTAGTGFGEVSSPVADSVWTEGHAQNCIHLQALTGTATGLVAGGTYGTLLRGTFAALDAEDIPVGSPSGSPQEYPIFGVAARGTETIATSQRVFMSENAGWRALPAPNISAACLPIAVATDSQGALFFAYNNCILEWRDGWHHIATVDGLRETLYDGTRQPDGSAAFWSYAGDVVRIAQGRVTTWHFEDFRQFAGAVSVNGRLYYAGTRTEGGVVALVALTR